MMYDYKIVTQFATSGDWGWRVYPTLFPPSLTGEHCTYRDIVVIMLISIPSSFFNFLKNGFLWGLGYDGSKGTAVNEIALCTNL